MGPNLYSDRMGVVLEVRFDDDCAESLLAAWASEASRLIAFLGWGIPELRVRPEHGGASLFFVAPVDALMASTEVNEQAWVLAENRPTAEPDASLVARLRVAIENERTTKPHLAAAYHAAIERGLGVTFDDESLTIGSGSGARTWPLPNVPDVSDIDWTALHDVPITLVTGSNGKTTTTRLVAAMWRAAGRATGWSCSDGVWVDDDQLEQGDYSGPAGARVVLRDTRVTAAVLETARGGILRRGLAVSRADVGIITNIAADHFGEYGIGTLRDLAAAKGVVARALVHRGTLVLNADDPLLVEVASNLNVRLAWFSTSAEHPALDVHVLAGGDAATLHAGRVMLHREDVWHDLGDISAMPLTLNGTATHNIENVLGAALLASEAGVPVDCIRGTLAHFGASPNDNPGRLQVYRFGEVTVLVDYAHNPDGLAALCETAMGMPAKRRLVILGQAGNRDDEQLRALARAAWGVIPFDHVIIKEMLTMLRGRQPGEIPAILTDELSRLGVPSDRVEVAPSELDAVRRAFAWARDGDLLVCPVHIEKKGVLAWLKQLTDAGWVGGMPLPS
ncbi:MAG: Mur ligase family protein [Gemmatimonadetes bacterium]|nr:Mur ligase family protein [Gemmatimonadota bacterium]